MLSVLKSNLEKKTLGFYEKKDFDYMIPDIMYEENYELLPHKNHPTSGKILVRYLYTPFPDIRRNVPMETVFYSNNINMSSFKTGDMIAFSGRSVSDVYRRLSTGTPFSHIGVVVHVPNKYTKDEELYICEVCSNTNNLLDPFHKNAHPGISFFHLNQRLHEHYGSAIWWIPLRKQLSRKRRNRLREWVRQIHHRDYINILQPDVNINSIPFLNDFGVNYKKVTTCYELYSPQFIFDGLIKSKITPMLEDDEIQSLSPTDVLKLPVYDKPILIKCNEKCFERYGTSRDYKLENFEKFEEGEQTTNLFKFSSNFSIPLAKKILEIKVGDEEDDSESSEFQHFSEEQPKLTEEQQKLGVKPKNASYKRIFI